MCSAGAGSVWIRPTSDGLLNRLDGERGNLRSLHLPENYRAARERWPMKLPFADTRTKVLVHLKR